NIQRFPGIAAWVVDAGGHPQVPVHVHAHAVAPAAFAKVVDETLLRQRAIGRQVERPDLAVAADLGVAVDHVQGLVIRRDGDAVGPADRLVWERPRDLARAVDAIHAFEVHLQVGAVGAVARIGEPDAAFGIDAAIVRTVVALAAIPGGQHRDLARP